METKGKIIITFNSDALNNNVINFDRYNATAGEGGIPSTISMNTTYTTAARTQTKFIQILNPTSIAGEQSAIAYQKYFNIDQNFSKLMTLTRSANVITIEATNNWSFINFSSSSFVTSSITVPVPDTFQLDAASLTTSSSPCDKIDVDILMTEQADSYTLSYGRFSPVPPITVTTNPFTVEINRAAGAYIKVNKSGSPTINVPFDQWGEEFLYIRKLYQENINIVVNENILLGATAVVNVSYGNQLGERPPNTNILSYSLDGTTYSSSNVFSALTSGTYTVYTKDIFNCVVQKEFQVVSSAETRSRFFEIPKLNSITFGRNETWNGLQNGIHKNRNNTLSLLGIQDFQFEEKLIVRNTDTVRIQFKSNYQTHIAKYQSCLGLNTSNSLVIEKMSNNLDLFESLASVVFSYNQNLALYFESGNVYDTGGTVIAQYELNGNLPDSAIIGTTVDISGFGLYPIVDIVYDEQRNKRAIVFDLSYNGVDQSNVIMKAYYDLLPFEVYEMDVPFNNLVIQGTTKREVRIYISATHPIYGTVDEYSEYISILEEEVYNEQNGLNNLLAINYYNQNNKSIFYLYGIKHFMRAEFVNFETTIIDESDVSQGDLKTFLLDSTLHEGANITFADMTYSMKIKLSLALSSESLFINGLGYVKNGNLTIEQIENTNLYSVSCELIRTNESFDINGEGNLGRNEDYTTTFIPRLVTGNNNYLKI